MARIFWTQSELEKLAGYIVQRHLALSDSRLILAAARQAQDALLPTHRHRELLSVMHLKTLLPVIKEVAAEAERQKQEREQEAREEASRPKHDTPAEVLTALGAMPISSFLDALADMLADRLADRLLDRISIPSVRVKEPQAQENPTPKKKLSVGVLGLMEAEQKIVASKFGAVSFRFYDKTLPKQLPNVDYMIGMVSFLSRPIDGRASSFYKHKYFRISGGLTALVSKVASMLNGNPNGVHHD